MEMDIDPSLGIDLAAEGLWSDEESVHSFAGADSDTEETPQPKKRGRRAKHEISPLPQIKSLLALATSQYATGDLQAAKTTIAEIIKQDNECVQGYTLLSHIYEDLGQKTEAVNALVSAAMNSPRDGIVWVRAARMSRDLGFWQQAIKCYDMGVKLVPGDLDVLFERSDLHREHGSIKKATDGFLLLLKTIPWDMTVIRSLARLYHNNNRTKDAVALYEDSRKYYLSLPQIKKPDGDLDTPFDWNELNFLLGLLSKATDPLHTIRVIQTTSRWLRGRSEETFWDDYNDAREWDEDDSRRGSVRTYDPGRWDVSRYSLPIEIRVKLGIQHLLAKNLPEAMIQFYFLEKEDVIPFIDLYWQVAEALSSNNHPAEALHIYTLINNHEQYNMPTTWAAMARCYAATGDLQQAEECYLMVSRENPTDYESRLRLAEIYEQTGRKEEALEVISAVVRDREHYRPTELASSPPLATLSDDTTGIGAPLIPNVNRRPMGMKPPRAETAKQQNQISKAEIEARFREHVLTQWQILEVTRSGMEKGDVDDRDRWMQVAGALIEEFCGVKGFFPSEKGKRITWFDNLEDKDNQGEGGSGGGRMKENKKRKRDVGGIEMRVEELHSRLQESLGTAEPEPSPEPEPIYEKVDLTTKEFRGLDFEKWFYIFMQYAILQFKYISHEDADDTLKSASDAAIFYQSPHLMRQLHVIHLAFRLHSTFSTDISACLRWFMQTYQFRSDPYRLYYLALGTSREGLEQFRNAGDQKYLLRQIKAIDSQVLGEPLQGAAMIVEDTNGFRGKVDRVNAVLLILYGHRLAGGGSFLPAQRMLIVVYYFRARELGIMDPLLELSIGLCYIQRSVQRQADNRHLMILQGLTFIFNYYHLIHEKSVSYSSRDAMRMKQEAEYNVGRVFHQLGLLTLAVGYYVRAINLGESEDEADEMTKYDGVTFEVVHNLALVYALSGNMGAAREVTEKYLVL